MTNTATTAHTHNGMLRVHIL